MVNRTVQVTYASEPGSPDLDNEDFLSAGPRLAVVLDGVTPMVRTDTGCRHGVAWYAQTLGGHLVRLAGRDDGRHDGQDTVPLADCLAEAIVATRDAHSGTCDLAHPDSPAATVAAVRLRGDVLDYLVLADSAVLLDLGDQRLNPLPAEDGIVVITDHRAGDVGRRLRAEGEVPSAPRVRSHRNRPGGYWVAADRPESAYEALSGTVDATGLRRLAVATDGATRLVDTFGSYDWRGALDAIEADGPAAWIARTREAERADAAAEPARRRGRGKVHDDASVVMGVVSTG
ncbi:protein phosphatase 2C domain-containing protein [Actinopolymorpha singaporensis]|uniref:Protein phosphatase 2C n=1 Tax=Actinopolymorpha singaporensis TaxID=117157 RepID=A0A1H1LZK2_9ACTN|nr:protein phosphatase 2C domain-containing protein [Actinopolymorpha singaporensis]SDR79973.1 Protein phosphatase 2C [Actinopolymorpha singaporensis]